MVFDVGKTHSKLSLWSGRAQLLARETRRNGPVKAGDYSALDHDEIEVWLKQNLSRFAACAQIGRIVPVGHGAAAALVAGGGLLVPPMDYEDRAGSGLRSAYDRDRDPFSETGSPRLAAGLNLGFQLHRLEQTAPWPDNLMILLWPQYWAWRLCGVAASEVSSLGCHTDLWRPYQNRFSDLALRRGWSARFPPVRHARETLGSITSEWIALGLPADCQVSCGMHDSNAALLAALGRQELSEHDVTILSTGTWFVAMRSMGQGGAPPVLDEALDCLVNVDVDGRPTPSARFMGGREAELLSGHSLGVILEDGEKLVGHARALILAGAMVLPAANPTDGPLAGFGGAWLSEPTNPTARRAAISLYLALRADAALDLIGSRNRLLVEGRFAEDRLFVRTLAALRPWQKVFTSHAQDDVCYGALRLMDPQLKPVADLTPGVPLDVDLTAYREAWRHAFETSSRLAS